MYGDLAKNWWLVVLRGVVALILGIALLVYPVKSQVLITWIFGLFAILEGLLIIILALIEHKHLERWGLVFLQGLLAFLLGILIVSWPGITLAIMFFLTGLWLLIVGIIMIVQAIEMRKEDAGEWLLAAGGLISILVGFFIIKNPTTSVHMAGVLFGLILILNGIFSTAFGFQLRGEKKKLSKEL